MIYDPADPHNKGVRCPFCGGTLQETDWKAGWYWHKPYSRRNKNCPLSAKRDKLGYKNSYLRLASVDTLPEGGDAKQGSVRSKGSAVPKGDAPLSPR